MVTTLCIVPRGRHDSMMIVLFLAALASGGLTIFLLWPHGMAVALFAAPFVASAVVLLAAVALSLVRGRGGEADGRGANVILAALSKLLPRQP